MEEVRFMERGAANLTRAELLELGMQYKQIRNYEKAKEYLKEGAVKK